MSFISELLDFRKQEQGYMTIKRVPFLFSIRNRIEEVVIEVTDTGKEFPPKI